MKKIIIGLLICLLITTPSFALGLKIDSGVLTLPNGNVVEVDAGYFLNDMEGKSVAEGIEVLKTELEKANAEKEAYKEAYEKEKDVNTELANVYEELYHKYELKSQKLEEYIETINERMKLVEKENTRLKGEVKLYQVTSVMLGIALIIVGI